MQYTGRENDNNGLYYYRARYYDPVLKRFLSEDLICLAGGSLSFYSYVNGNPVMFTDPEGLAKSNPGARSGGGRYDSPYYRRGGVENKGTLPPIDPVAFRMRKLHQQFQNEGIPEGACDYNPALCIVPEEDPFEACELECQDKDHGVCPAPPPAPRFGQVLTTTDPNYYVVCQPKMEKPKRPSFQDWRLFFKGGWW